MHLFALLFASLTVVPATGSNTAIETEPSVASVRTWDNEPTGFRDVEFGSTLAEAEAILGPMKCSEVSEPLAHKQCSTSDKKKAFRLKDKVVYTIYYFHENRFVAVRMSQSTPTQMHAGWSSQYEPLYEAFVQRFGPPMIDEDDKPKEWLGEHVRVTISKSRSMVLVGGLAGDTRIPVTSLGPTTIETNAWIAAQRSAKASKVAPF
jgi:hypothetical protein